MTQNDNIADKYDKFISKNMCTNECPCWSGKIGDGPGQGPNEQLWKNLPESVF